MTEVESFARRWSRLKRQTEVIPAPAPALPEAEPEEIPPPADTIALEDMAGWLKRRVPEGWRQAALRRLWTADPAIRNFIGPADYAWDWNTPGSMPGWGPLRALDDIGSLLARAIGEPLPPPPDEPPTEACPEMRPEMPLQPEPELLLGEAEAIVIPELACTPGPAPAATPPAVLRRGGRATPV